MTKSMTAFAQAEEGGVTWEIRSVNQRFVDVNFRMPESFRHLEIKLRGMVKPRIQRGKLDCTLRVDTTAQDGLAINDAMLTSLVEAIGKIDAITGNTTPPAGLELLKWPGVTGNASDGSVEETESLILDGFSRCIDNLVSMRAVEGGALAEVIRDQLTQLEGVVADIKAALPDLLDNQQRKIRDKVEELGVEVDQDRLEQELVFIAQKTDVQEELDRLAGHVTQVRDTLADAEPAGRRLDFLMQELNREANTLGAKVNAVSTSLQAVDLKVLIEQMREQVQNIE